MDILQTLSTELSLPLAMVSATVALMDGGNTVPFIARYRKEVTGSLDDTTLRKLAERLAYLRGLETRREEVRAAIAGQEKLTPEIEAALDGATLLAEIEDIYRPFRPHRKTRADAAKEKGLQPLATLLMEQRRTYPAPLPDLAGEFVDPEKDLPDAEAALNGACDILAEEISDRADYRGLVRSLTLAHGVLTSEKAGEDPGGTYAGYYEFREPLRTIPDHRLLALNRAEKEGILKVALIVPTDLILNGLFSLAITDYKSPAFRYVARAAVDGYDRLMAPSVGRELRADRLDTACENAIRLFSENLRHLLLTPPLKGKTVLGLDPGYRTGCKLAVVDRTGKVLDTAVIYPTKPHERIAEAEALTVALIKKHRVDAVAIGNGTASKESEIFIANLLKKIPEKVAYAMVSEAGASVYSASPLAAEEFPDYDVTLRSAVSIARRLQDSLAELVKIEPRSIGVGQYQHDMKPARLSEALGGVVEDCVNAVGVDLNTASPSLLSYVSGIGGAAAKSIVEYREKNGEFHSRDDLRKVPRIGAKTYEQCIGFLRVPGSEELLDRTGVHPESYPAAKQLLSKFGYRESDAEGGLQNLRKDVKEYGASRLAKELGIGEPTLADIVTELEKPGRDLRDSLPPPDLREELLDLKDLKPGTILSGTVRNVTDFGAFVDIGVHRDGLVHISQISGRFVSRPSDLLAVGDRVTVKVLEVDEKKNRISLTMKL